MQLKKIVVEEKQENTEVAVAPIIPETEETATMEEQPTEPVAEEKETENKE